jgi:hypothetical protein
MNMRSPPFLVASPVPDAFFPVRAGSPATAASARDHDTKRDGMRDEKRDGKGDRQRDAKPDRRVLNPSGPR